jgi:hypothetical protein
MSRQWSPQSNDERQLDIEDAIDAATPEMDQSTGEPKTEKNRTDNKGKFRYKFEIPERLAFEQVNSVSWKLTDGTFTQVPTSHGQWSGHRVTKAIAWVIDVGDVKPAWIARFKDQCCGPLPLKEAKAAAIAMAKGEPGDYRVDHPTSHLNGLAARLHDQ